MISCRSVPPSDYSERDSDEPMGSPQEFSSQASLQTGRGSGVQDDELKTADGIPEDGTSREADSSCGQSAGHHRE